MDAKFVLVALGGNLPNQDIDPKDTLLKALSDIENIGFSINKRSFFYQTPAFPHGSGPDYVNAVIQLRVAKSLTINEIFSPLAAIELAHGRTRKSRWAGRTLDIDMLGQDDLVWPNLPTYQKWAGLPPKEQAILVPDQMILPHPRLHERAFVLAPLMDIAPDWRHPVLGQTVRQMFAALPDADRASVRVLA
jgi:2-amino-4-hydroxy-6-hydroxymethyldihydropteridine diphosphokinase